MCKLVSLFFTILVVSLLPQSFFAKTTYTKWQIGYHETERDQPVNWYPATVPGAVQLDVMNAENYKQPWWYADNVTQFEWMEDVWFTYRTSFVSPELKEGERLYFYSKGIDYKFKIVINGETIWEQEGMFTYVDIDITNYLKENNELKVILYPVPKLGFDDTADNPDNFRKNARESAKPAVSYRWDWHPRCITRGIWDKTFLEIRKRTHINDVWVSYVLDEKLSNALMNLEVSGENIENKRYQWSLKDSSGKTVLNKKGVFLSNQPVIEAELSSPELWWPNGYGNPYLYSSELMLFDDNMLEIDHHETKVGFRKIELITNEKSWINSSGFPATSPLPPASLSVNNRRIFAKGSNWVHPEVFIGNITADRYREQIELAKNAHFNILRVWGGGIVNKESFYDICDELGLLVWQEFPLACNYYSGIPTYLKILEQEAVSIVKRLRKHASLALWSGGNELYWAGMTEQSLPLRLLNSISYNLNPRTPYINTSPYYGVGHGHYLFYDRDSDKEVFQWMAKARNTAYTEFGVPGISNVDVLKSFIPEDELFPPIRGSVWSMHHGFNAWRESSWAEMETYRKYFGDPASLEELVDNSQLMQSEGYKFIFEEARRQKPYCSMAINWCFQEPWPTAANNSLINWPNEPKEAYYHVSDALRPVLVSMRASKFQFSQGNNFSFDLYLLNDTYNKIEKCDVKLILIYDNKEEEIYNWTCPEAMPFENVEGPSANFIIPKMDSKIFEVKVKVNNHPEYESTYRFAYKHTN